jgi:hypothetical protein
VADPSLARVAAGFAMFVFPGAAWAWALAPRLGWARAAPLALVLAFTLLPALLFALDLLFEVPIDLATMMLFATALGLAGVAVGIQPAVMKRFAD